MTKRNSQLCRDWTRESACSNSGSGGAWRLDLQVIVNVREVVSKWAYTDLELGLGSHRTVQMYCDCYFENSEPAYTVRLKMISWRRRKILQLLAHMLRQLHV